MMLTASGVTGAHLKLEVHRHIYSSWIATSEYCVDVISMMAMKQVAMFASACIAGVCPIRNRLGEQFTVDSYI